MSTVRFKNGRTARQHKRALSLRSRARLLTAVMGALCVIFASGCGSSGSGASSAALPAAQVQPPPSIASSKKLVVCSDEVEPPFAYRNGEELTGSEVEIMNAVGKLLGVHTEYSQIGFDGLFAALQAGKCDAAIDEIADTPEREKTITDVDYMKIGQTFMVRAGNPLHLTSFASLCGHSVGAVLASVDIEYLHELSKQCVAKGAAPVHAEGFNDDPTGAEALITSKIDAFQEDTPLLNGLIARSNGQIVLSPQQPIKQIPCGIAVALHNTALAAAIQKALNKLYANGQVQSIFTKFNEGPVGLPGSEPVSVNAATQGGKT